MGRLAGHFMSKDVIGLWLADTLLFVIMAYIVIFVGIDNFGWTIHAYHYAPFEFVRIICFSGFTAAIVGLYQPKSHVNLQHILSGIISSMVIGYAVFLAASLSFRSGIADYLIGHERFLFSVLLLWSLCLLLTRLSFVAMTRAGLFQRRLLVIGQEADWARANQRIDPAFGPLFRVVNVVPSGINHLADAAQLKADRIWAIVVTPDARRSIDPDALMTCRSLGIHVYNEIEFRERHLKRVDIDRLSAGWLAYHDGFSTEYIDRAVRRLFDITIAFLLLLITGPLMLVSAIAIKLDSKGPVFYRQKRVGLHGRQFTIIKFRSMRTDAEADGQARWATVGDSRVTRIGAFMRLTRIDELPQLFNVLRGEMCLIGPRPERPNFVDELNTHIPRYRDRSYVKPGITGWAQINFPYGASMNDARMKLSYDLYYVKHRCLLLDLLILAATVRVVLFQEGAR